MNDDKWDETKDNIRNKFEILDERIEDVIYEDRVTNKERKIGDRDILEFMTPTGRMKIEREKKLVVIDKKHHYHKARADAVSQLIFSENEYSDRIQVFKKDLDEWELVEMRGEGIGG